MKFPSAAKGMKRIFSAEILQLVGVICLIFAVALLISGVAADKVSNGSDEGLAILGAGFLGSLILGLAFTVLYTIAFIMHLVGIINARHDEDSFSSALIFLIISVVFSCLSMCFVQKSISSIFVSVSSLASTISTIFVIVGGVKLADRLNRGDVSTKGANVLKLIIAIGLISCIVSIVSTFTGSIFASVTSIILIIVVLVLDIIKYILYLSFLAKAKKMLA